MSKVESSDIALPSPERSASRRRLSAERYDELRAGAHDLYLAGLSYRDIAQQLQMGSGGYVQVARWAKKDGWAAERADHETARKAARKVGYLTRVATIQDAHLRLAEKVRHIAELALRGYCVLDERGDIVDIKVNPRTGFPAISPFAIQQMLLASTELERKALGFELLPQGELEQVSNATTVVDAASGGMDVGTLRQIGDFLARQALVASVDGQAPEAGMPSTGWEGEEPGHQGQAVDDEQDA